jgi:hypothetical protein
MNELIAMMWVAMVLYVLRETSAVYEYLKLLRIPNFISKLKDYKSELEFNPQMSYGEYIRIFHDNFLIRWATCPYCFGLPLAVAASIGFSNWTVTPITYLGGLLSYWAFTRAIERLEEGFND